MQAGNQLAPWASNQWISPFLPVEGDSQNVGMMQSFSVKGTDTFSGGGAKSSSPFFFGRYFFFLRATVTNMDTSQGSGIYAGYDPS